AFTLTDVTGEAGIAFHHVIGATGRFYFPEIMGSGCALLDYDGDGDLDVFLVQGEMLEPGRRPEESTFPPPRGTPAGSRLFRNELIRPGGGGTLRFTDVTEASGAGVAGYGMGAATADYDNDGDVDLFITRFGTDVLLRNDGDGTFTDVSAASGLGADPRWKSSATFFDHDNDGRLDLYVAAYADFTLATHKACFTPSGERDYCNPRVYPGLPGRLYRNQGDGTFRNVTREAGLDTAYGHALGVAAADLDGNGWDDLYVANDGDANQLWLNDGGRFADLALLHGAAYNEHGKPEAGMGIAAGDYDDDGDVDFYLTHLNGEANRLFQNRGDGVFEDVTARRGLGHPSLPFTGFGTGWIDLDRDGDLDLFVANGDVTRMESQAGHPYPYRQTNQVMLNAGDGRFTDGTAKAGPALAEAGVWRGAAFGDLDNDGDVDVLVSANNGPARLLRLDAAPSGEWLALRVVDKARRRDAIGASVRLTLSDGRTLTRWVRTDGSYLSASDPRVHFSWKKGTAVASIHLTMPGGKPEPLSGVPVGAITTVAR
ncbi:MAG TPA: CRTAC1 family protein, partial [Candidatus Polarisedimenticolia bacterium]|nr:CRTAC1 family protein [Candidatus Polarisedimenticolia bacterium]